MKKMVALTDIVRMYILCHTLHVYSLIQLHNLYTYKTSPTGVVLHLCLSSGCYVNFLLSFTLGFSLWECFQLLVRYDSSALAIIILVECASVKYLKIALHSLSFSCSQWEITALSV